MKKILSALLAVVMIFSVINLTGVITNASTYSGTCGADSTYTMDTETGEFEISGSGAMYSKYQYPWYSYSSSVKILKIGEGVTSIGEYAFEWCSGIQAVVMPLSMTDINFDAFLWCSNLKDVYYAGTEADKEALNIGAGNDYLNKATWHYECDGTESMYRLYNPNTGEHLYTALQEEVDFLTPLGWENEGVAWVAPIISGNPVYRLYNPNSGDHHYTMNTDEKKNLISLGWSDEGIAWYSGGDIPVYRLFNPNATVATHHYTGFDTEKNWLTGLGWQDEDVAWYAVSIPENDLAATLQADTQLMTMLHNVGIPILNWGALDRYETISCDDNNSWFRVLYGIYSWYPTVYDYSIYPITILDKSEYPDGAYNAFRSDSFEWVAENIFNASVEQIALYKTAVIDGQNMDSSKPYYGVYKDDLYCGYIYFATEGMAINNITIDSATENDGIYDVKVTYDYYYFDSDTTITLNLKLNKNEVDGVQYWALMSISKAE